MAEPSPMTPAEARRALDRAGLGPLPDDELMAVFDLYRAWWEQRRALDAFVADDEEPATLPVARA
jgi:hypothetical protein